jgi:superfamily I DNA/RNA helicase
MISSVHKSKGLEWENVYYYKREDKIDTEI